MDKKVISLQERRNLQAKKSRKEYLPEPDRIRELEEDVLRLIDLSLEMEERLWKQERFLSKLLRLLRDQASVSSSEVPELPTLPEQLQD